MTFQYYDFRKDTQSQDICLLFPSWEKSKERVAIFSPHDDDAILGTGYLIQAITENGGEPFVFIFCNGNGGYSVPEDKDVIVETRAAETKAAYLELGLGEDNVIRFDYPDYSVFANMGWMLPGGFEGSYPKTLGHLRSYGITRLVIPNRYREHFDHETVGRIGAFDGPQAGDPVLVDWGHPTKIRSFLEYAVWGDFSPEDALISGADLSVRANRAIKAPGVAEKKVARALAKFESQQKIIKRLIDARAARRCADGFVELYVDFDPRPTLSYKPYIDLISRIDAKH